MKNYINKEFEIANCKVITGDTDKTIFKRRHINVVNIDTGEILELDVGYTPVYTGEYYTIEYLPNVKVGKIIKIGQ